MTDTPLIRPGPRIDHPEELDRLVRQIVEKVDPVAIYLFGSRAHGDAHEDSDYDLLIVVPDDFPAGNAHALTAFSLIRGRRIPMDAAMTREGDFAWRRAAVGTLEYKVARDGVALYERDSRPRMA
jgi:predicted nucleotidyltransferase